MTRLYIIAVLALIAAAGCSKAPGQIFKVTDPPLVWPAPPDAPRIKYVGQLTSTDDLSGGKTAWQAFTEALTGKRNVIRLVTPKDAAVWGNKVYVVDTDQSAVVAFDLDTRKTIAMTGRGDNRLVKPVHIAVSDRRVFVSDVATRSVAVFDHNGRMISTWGKGQFIRPAGLCFCPVNRRLYVVDTGAHCVIVLDEAGKRVGKFGGRGERDGLFNYPLSITFSQGAGLLVTDAMNARVQRFDLDGKFISAFGQQGDVPGSFALPKGIACDSRGHVYVVDGRFENVQIFDLAGRLLMKFGSEGQKPGQFYLPEGIFIDNRDRIWVADTYNRRIQVFQYLHAEEKSQ